MIEKLGITPGPWNADDYGLQIWAGSPGDGRMIAEARGWGWLQKMENGAEIQDANQTLIAAAPEMLDWIIDHAYEIRGYLHKKSRIVEIIEKATGKTWEEIKELI